MCSKRIHEFIPLREAQYADWGKYNCPDPKYCTKLDMIIDRPLRSMRSEHAHCYVGLECSDGGCSLWRNDVCPARTQSDELSHWKITCKYGEYECPHVCFRKGEKCDPNNQGLSCCLGLKCNSGDRTCIEDDYKVGGHCTEDDDNICQGYFCLKAKL